MEGGVCHGVGSSLKSSKCSKNRRFISPKSVCSQKRMESREALGARPRMKKRVRGSMSGAMSSRGRPLAICSSSSRILTVSVSSVVAAGGLAKLRNRVSACFACFVCSVLNVTELKERKERGGGVSRQLNKIKNLFFITAKSVVSAARLNGKLVKEKTAVMRLVAIIYEALQDKVEVKDKNQKLGSAE